MGAYFIFQSQYLDAYKDRSGHTSLVANYASTGTEKSSKGVLQSYVSSETLQQMSDAEKDASKPPSQGHPSLSDVNYTKPVEEVMSDETPCFDVTPKNSGK